MGFKPKSQVKCGGERGLHKEVKPLHRGIFVDSVGANARLKSGQKSHHGYWVECTEHVRSHLHLQSLRPLFHVLCEVAVVY